MSEVKEKKDKDPMFISKDYWFFNKGKMVCKSIRVDYLYLGWMDSKRGSWRRIITVDNIFIRVPSGYTDI